ncbi:MAG: rod shape-determining protein MreC [Bacteroidales bacterium]|nr:rod shape-determining protein MreC [Bacteroidales bacterium]
MPKERKIIPTIISAAIFIIMEVAALNMLAKNNELQQIWLARGAHKFMAKTWGMTESIKYYFSLKKQNERLAQENFILSEKLREYLEAGAVLEETRDVQPITGKVRGYEYNSASIVKISNNKQHNYIIIDKGSEDGIGTRSGIITAQGVVGIVDAVSNHYAYALSFRNADVSISARLGNEGAVGPLIWDGHSTNGAILKEIPLQYKFQPGDTVWTSGYSSIFPPDIPLGVAGNSKIVNGATNEIQVTLFQDFTALRYVTIVENKGLEDIESLEAKGAQHKK